jgi:flavin reductase (DIM6/NTAB) family NADH-FMN oxidoreductase RutF
MTKPPTALSQVTYGLYVVGSKGDDAVNAMTANWITQASFEPEIVALAVESDSFTRQLIDQGRVFAVSVLKSGQKDVAAHFVNPQRHEKDKLGDYAIQTRKTGAPILADASAYLDCRVVSRHVAGDHVVFFGEVVDSGLLDPAAEPLTLRQTGWRYGG